MDGIEVEVSVGEGVAPPVDVARVEAAVRHVLREEGVASAEISVALVSDAEIASLNEDYLQHEGPTDVISFALHEEGESPLGDIYVGVDQATRQAAEFDATPAEEVLRLAIHGTLHVLGWEHPEGAGRTESEMFVRQEELLKRYFEGSPPEL
ncbi:MAG TPA: rRNA maturation RNase YbeY [Longimicrobium sp.]|jgi:probable rRNA maturation factor|nr:rRNA maturation RNase YbeY [Longimicrobium sp.]